MLVMPGARVDGVRAPAPSSRTLKRSRSRALPSSVTTIAARARRVLVRVLQRLEDAEVDRALHLGREAPDVVRHEVDPDLRAHRDVAQRVVEPAVGEHRRVDAVRERPQLLERLVDLVLELAQALDAALGIPPDDLLRQLELDPQRDEPLLGAVVQVALDPAPLVLGAGRDAGARELELAHRRLGLGGQPLVLEHHGGHRGARLEQLGPLEQPFVVDDRGHHLAVDGGPR